MFRSALYKAGGMQINVAIRHKWKLGRPLVVVGGEVRFVLQRNSETLKARAERDRNALLPLSGFSSRRHFTVERALLFSEGRPLHCPPAAAVSRAGRRPVAGGCQKSHHKARAV